MLPDESSPKADPTSVPQGDRQAAAEGSWKFLHAADLHLDSPLRGLDAHEGAPVERLRGATRQALRALVDLALKEAVSLVVLAGDLYDGDWQDFRTGLYLRQELLRLTQAGIRVFIVRGNHDAQSVITRQLPAVEGVHVFSAREAETVVLEAPAVAVHGRSFPERAVDEDLVPGYPPAVPGVFNIGVLHTSLAGSPDHDPYAPTTVEALVGRGYDYFALGHVHARQIIREADPRIVFPGNLQGRMARETGPKGCELVTVVGQRIVAAESVALDVVRWHRLHLDARPLQDIDGLARAVSAAIDTRLPRPDDRLHALRVVLEGESALQRIEAAQPGVLAAAVWAAAQERIDHDLWIESVRLALRPRHERAGLARRGDAVGELAILVDELLADEAGLRAWLGKVLADRPRLPTVLAHEDPLAADGATLVQTLLDAEATVFARLAPLIDSAGDADDAGSKVQR